MKHDGAAIKIEILAPVLTYDGVERSLRCLGAKVALNFLERTWMSVMLRGDGVQDGDLLSTKIFLSLNSRCLRSTFYLVRIQKNGPEDESSFPPLYFNPLARSCFSTIFVL